MYRIKIEQTRDVETLTNRQWVQGGPDGRDKDGAWGYTPQILQVQSQTVTVLEMQADELDVVEVAKAILEHAKRI